MARLSIATLTPTLLIPVLALLSAGLPLRAAVVTWVGKGDGRSWSQPANWDAGRLPTGADEVLIPKNFTTVDHLAGTTRIRRITADGGLRLAGGTLVLTNGISTAGGSFVVLAGATLQGSGPLVRFSMSGSPVTWEGDVRATDGAQLELTRVVRIAARNPDWAASGKGTQIDAGAVTNITLPTEGWFPVTADEGARISLPALVAIRGPLRVTATDGGIIDLSSLQGRWSGDGFTYRPEIHALRAGRILGRQLSELDLVDVEIDAANAVTTLPWTTFTRGTLRIAAATPDLSQLSNLDDAHLILTDGAVVNLPALQTLRGRNPDWQADDPGTLLAANRLTGIALSKDGWFPVSAGNQAEIQIRGLATLRGPLRPAATTEGVIDLSALSGLWSAEGFIYPAELTAVRGGRVLAPGVTQLDTVHAEFDNPKSLATGQWTAFTRGTLRVVGAIPDLGRLANLDESSLDALDGAVLRLPALQAIRGRNPEWKASDFGTLIEARALATLGLTTGGWFPVTAQNQARIDLSGLNTLRGPLRPTAESGGIIDLGGLRGTWTSDGFTYPAILIARENGRILCPGITRFDVATVELDDASGLATGQWTAFTRGLLKLVGARPDLSGLASVDDSDLQLSDGAVARLPALRQVQGRNPNWEATGAGTLLDAGAVTNIALTPNGWFPVTADNQAIINLSGLPAIEGPLRPTARNGGVVDLSALRGRWSSAAFVYPHILSAESGGRILCGGIVAHVNGEILVEPEGFIPTDRLLQIRDGRVVAKGLGALVSLPSLRDQAGTTFEALDGGRIVFAGLPRIVTHPAGRRVDPGDPFEFTVVAAGDGPITYQWLRNGQPLKGQTGATLRLAAVTLADAGSYSVRVSNPVGSVESDPAFLGILLPSLPFNDLLASRGTLRTPSGAGLADNLGAGREPGEPRHAGKPGGRSVWISWLAPNSGNATFRTSGSSFDTLLAVYARNRDGTLAEVASDEDSGGFLNSLVHFNAIQDTEYLIAVDGFAGATGTIVFSWDIDLRLAVFPSILRHPADTLAIDGSPARFAVAAEPAGAQFQWFFQGRPLSGQTRPELVLPDVSAKLAGAYHVAVSLPGGTSIVSRTALLEVADRRQTGAALSADKLADLFADGELAGGGGLLQSAILASTPPPAVGLPGSQWTDNSDSTRSPDEPAVCEVLTSASRWFRLRFNLPSGVSQPVKITTTGSEIASLLAVFTNQAAPTLIACDLTEPPQTASAEVQVNARRNVDYLVLVDGLNGARGKIQLNWAGEELPPPQVEIVGGRFHVQMRVTPGIYDWQEGSALGSWQAVVRTNLSGGVFEYLSPLPATAPSGFYRLVPAP